MYKKTKLKVEKGNLVKNRTLKYLVPLLKLYGEKFVRSLNSNNILAFGVSDYSKTDTIMNTIYIRFDINGLLNYGKYIDPSEGRKLFSDTLSYFKLQDYYVSDYSCSSDEHILIVKLPKNVINDFLEGNYSKLYTEKELKLLKEPVKNIVTKDKKSFEIFKELIYEDFNVEIDNDNRECDYPPILSQEIFNYERNN